MLAGKLAIVPRLATRFEWADPVTLVLHLRPGVVFRDSTPFDAAASAGAEFGLHPVCSGPFRFVERVAQDRIALERFSG